MFWLAAGLSILGAIGSFQASAAQSKAAAEGERIARENATIARKEAAEAERRARNDQRKVEAEAKLAAYAGGAKGDSQNFEQVQSSIITEHVRQLDWLKWSGETRAKQIEREGAYQRQVGEAQAQATMWSGVSQLGKAAGTMYTGLAPAQPYVSVGSTQYNGVITGNRFSIGFITPDVYKTGWQ